MNAYVLESTSHRKHRLTAAIAVLVVIGALLTLFGWSRGWMRERVDFTTFLPDNAGVSKSSLVVINGLAVGRVRETRLVERDGGLKVEVRFWVEADQANWLRRGSRVLVRSDLVNAARLELQPALATTELVPAGAELPGAIAPDLMTQLLELQPTIRKLLDEVGQMIAGLNERAEQFDPILAKVEKQIDSIDAHLGAVTGTIEDARGLLAQIKTDEAAIAGELGESLRRLNGELLPELTEAVRTNRAEIAVTLGSVNRTLADVEKQMPALLQLSQETLKNSRDLSEAAANTWPFSRYTKKKAEREKKAGESGK
jgi:hypothetical protein